MYMNMKQDIGIDLGTANVLIYVKGKGIVLQEPSIVAIETKTGKVIAVGNSAKEMLGRNHENIKIIRPLQAGVISDYKTTLEMLKYFIDKTCGRRRFVRPRIMVCVPSSVTEVEKRAAIDASMEAGGSRIQVIEEPIAAAIGAGLDIFSANGNMIIDIGGGTTDVAVISLGGIVNGQTVKIAGDAFNESITRYVRKKFNLLIGEKTAEDLKIMIGSVHYNGETVAVQCKGRDLVTGLPKSVEITNVNMIEALQDDADVIAQVVHNVLEGTMPELIADISINGIWLTGGGALLDGLGRFITEKTGVTTHIAENALDCVAIGTGLSLESMDKLEQLSGRI